MSGPAFGDQQCKLRAKVERATECQTRIFVSKAEFLFLSIEYLVTRYIVTKPLVVVIECIDFQGC